MAHSTITPTLPSDVLSVIAQHLAGLCAFGTLASLNTTNHQTHDVTLPVLYETLLLDRKDGLALVRLMDAQPVPIRFRYTRFITCSNVGRSHLHYGSESLIKLRTMFPNLVMIIWTCPVYFSAPFSGGIDLLQPLNTTTMFRIVSQTPVVHVRKQGVCPLRTIYTIWVSPTGRIDDDAKRGELPIYSFGGNLTGITVECDDAGSEEHTAAILQVLKISSRECVDPRQAKSLTGNSTPHVNVPLIQEALEPFVEHWSAFASAHPQILLPRLRIVIRQSHPREYSQRILGFMIPTYTRHIAMFEHLSPPHGTLDTLVRMEVASPDWGEPDSERGKHVATLRIQREDGEVKLNVRIENVEDDGDDGANDPAGDSTDDWSD